MTELAQRAVAAMGRWLPGMLPLVVDEDGDCVACARVWRTQGGHTVVPAEAFPDLTDDLTRLGLLALVREAFGCPHLSAVYDSDSQGWGIWYDYGDDDDTWVVLGGHYSPTEAEALVKALEAAP